MDVSASSLSVKYLRYILRANKQVNLTAITDWNTALVLHLEDSLAALPIITQLLNGTDQPHILDIGSGGGFPAIPLAIETGFRTTLVESVKKKTAIVQQFIDKDGLREQVNIEPLRAEEAAVQYAEKVDIVTARALSELPVLVELASPFLKLGGYLVAYKASPENSEISRGMSAAKLVGLELINREDFTLSDHATKRSLFIYQKTSYSKVKLPRRNGASQKNPLA